MNELKRPELPPGTDVGGLVVEELIGAGGFGTVFRARHPESGSLYALKFIPLEQAEAWGQREFATLLRIHHPNLVSLKGSGYWPLGTDDFLWLQLAYIPGRELDVWAAEENPDALEASGKVLDVGRGLAVAHQASVVHRDVKEPNILVSDDDGAAVLVDFGVGYYPGAPTLTEGLFPPGTLAYRSPEAWRFREEHAGQRGVHYRGGPADDLYALGVVLYRLLTDRLPFQVTGSEESLRAVIHQAPLPPHLVNPRVPRALGEVCLKLLAKAPEARYPSAVALCEELSLLRERADDAWRMPLREPRPSPRRARSPRRTWLQTALALALVAAMATVGWLTRQGGPLAARPEVARPPPAPEAESTAAPPPVESTPVVAVPPAAPAKDPAPVKNPQKSRESQPEPKRPRAGSVIPKACAGLVGLALQACVGAQPRENLQAHQGPPPPEECPPGAVETMKKRAMGMGRPYATAIHPAGGPMLVHEGPFSTYWVDNDRMPLDTVLTGRLYYTPDRLYVRLTQARTPKGEVYAICMEMREGGVRGSRMEKGSTPDHLILHALEDFHPVERFE